MTRFRTGTPIYAVACAIGVFAAGLVMPWPAILGDGPGWALGFADQSQALTGHLAFQADAWRWPPLFTTRLFWPHGVSVALSDGNPLVSLLAKLWVTVSGQGPGNWLGIFLALCWVAQPVAAAYAARGFGASPAAAIAAAALATAWPALLARMIHVNLCAHAWLLLALGLIARRRAGTFAWRHWAAPAAVLLGAILTHPYLFQLCAALFAALPLGRALARDRDWRRDALAYALSVGLAAAVLRLLSGPLGGGDHGFVIYSMNLLSPFVPQRSGLFGPDLPIIDATTGQYEGFNYLGAGVLLLVLVGIAVSIRRCPALRSWSALIIVLAGLTALSLSSRVYAGQWKLLDLGTKPWEDIFGTFRSSGRAFWPAGYAIMLAATVAVGRLPRLAALPLLAAAVLLQLADARPLWAEARTLWAQGILPPTPPIPAGTTLFSVSPFPSCGHEIEDRPLGSEMLLAAARAGARLGEIGLGRPPRWFSCRRVVAELAELPLLPGEVRAYFGKPQQAPIVPARLGPDTRCSRDGYALVCGRGVGPLSGTPLPQGEARPPLALPMRAEGADLAALLGADWVRDDAGAAWSEGSYATLMLPVPPGQPVEITLALTAATVTPGGARTVAIAIGRQPDSAIVTLRDQQPAETTIRIPATADGLIRLALSTDRAIDPAARGMPVPARRTAFRLGAIALAH